MQLASWAFTTALAHYRALFAAIAVVLVPTAAIGSVALGVARSDASAHPSSSSATLAEVVALFAVVVGSLLAQAAGVHAAASALVGGRPDWRASCAAALSRWRLVAAAGVAASLLSTLGLLLFVIPGIVLYLNFFVVMPVVVLEGARTGPALRRSAALVRGRRPSIFGALLLVEIATLVCSIPIGAVAGSLVPHSGLAGDVASQLGAYVAAIAVMPVEVTLVVLAYLDGRRREGTSATDVASQLGLLAQRQTTEVAGWATPGSPVAPGWGEREASNPDQPSARDAGDDRSGWPAASPKPTPETPARPSWSSSWPNVSPKPTPPTRSDHLRGQD
jgi:hypothetical protein